MLATPVARRMAQEHHLNLTQVAGSGPGGRILRGDVERYLTQSDAGIMHVGDQSAAHHQESVRSGSQEQRSDSFTPETTASLLRRAIAQRMVQSKQTIHHFYITISITMDDALALREQINAALSENEKSQSMIW